jgi:DNA recombination protein RmuC
MDTALIITNIVLTLALVAIAAFVMLRRSSNGNTSADADVIIKAHESFLTELHRFGESIGVMEKRLREELRLSETTTRDALTKLISLARDDQLTAATTLRTEVSKNLAVQLETTLLRLDATRATLDKQLTDSRETTRVQLVEVRDTTQAQLTAMREENQKKLDEMRNVVDEKLQATLTARLDGAFKIVSERLE